MKRRFPGFTLVELIAAIVIILILCAVVLVVNGNARERALRTRVMADLESINTAKVHWALDHPLSTFPTTPADQFSVLKRYLDPVQAAGDLASFQPPGVTYTINGLGAKAVSNPIFDP